LIEVHNAGHKDRYITFEKWYYDGITRAKRSENRNNVHLAVKDQYMKGLGFNGPIYPPAIQMGKVKRLTVPLLTAWFQMACAIANVDALL
jgi:hypothetical protein